MVDLSWLHDPTFVRGACLLVPIGAAFVAWHRHARSLDAADADDDRRRRTFAAMLVACCWNALGLATLHVLASWFGWWRYEAAGGTLAGMPVDLYLGWVALWGPLPYLVAPSLPLWRVATPLLLLDLVAMPSAAPVVRLGPAWIVGDVSGIVICVVPAQLLARWTVERRCVRLRALMQMTVFSGLFLVVLPAVILEQTGGPGQIGTALDALRARPLWQHALALQVLALPAALGLSAVWEFATRGGGTPLPYDPPVRLVTSGPYAYVANPMQLSMTLLFVGWGAYLGSAWIVAAAVVCVGYGAGIAAWDERGQMARQHGESWRAYRAAVRAWLPRWRPYAAAHAPTATLYVAEACAPCSETWRWIARRRPVGLTLAAAESHPVRDLDRMTYAAPDGAEWSGVAALARALEHLHFGWALAGWLLRLPVVCQLAQVIVDACGGGPRRVPRRAPVLG